MKQKYLIANSLATARKLVLKDQGLGSIPCDQKIFFQSLYSHPGFLYQNIIVESENSLSRDSRLLEVRKALGNSNYFQDALEVAGIRSVIGEGLEELKLAGLQAKDIKALKLDNKEKENGLKELLNAYSKENAFSYAEMLQTLKERLQAGKYEAILKDVHIQYPAELELNGIEKEIFDLVLEKTESSKLSTSQGSFEDSINSLKSNIKMRSTITEEALILDVLEWMKDKKLSFSSVDIMVFDYHVYAPILFHLAKKFQLPIYLSNGLRCSEFFFYEKLVKRLHAYAAEEVPLASLAQKVFPKKENELEDIFLTKALGLVQDVKTYAKSSELEEHKAYELLIDKMEGLRFSAKELGQDENGLMIGTWRDFQDLPLQNLAVLGLEAKNYPIRFRPNALLSDEEREGLNTNLGLNLPLSTDQRYANVLENIVTQVQDGLYLGFTSHSKTTGNVKIPSSFFNEVFNVLGEEASLEAVYMACGISKDILADIDLENPFNEIKESKELLENSQNLKKSIFSEKDNIQDYGVFDKTEYSESASKLEKFFSCPYSYYLYALKKIYPPDGEEEDITFWLDPMMRGSYVHDVYEGLLKPFVASDSEDYPSYIDSLGEEDLKRVISEVEVKLELSNYRPEVPDHVKDVEREDIFNTAITFLEKEVEYSGEGFYPIMLEKDFKGLGAKLLDVEFTGKIDRVDTNGKGDYRIIDYKTGTNRHKRNSDMFTDKGKYIHLQHGLYSIAAKHLLDDVKTLEAGYYFATDKGEWARVMLEDSKFSAKFESLIELFKTQAEAGKYYRNSDACTYCDYKLICLNRPKVRKKYRDEEVEQIADIAEALYEK